MAFRIVTIAELTKNKGLKYGMEAVSGLDVQWHIYGEGKDKYEAQDNVKFLGFKQSTSELLSQYDLFLFPSIKEGLPYAVLEAGQAGLPVIATNIGGIPDIIEHEKTGLLVPPKDPQALRTAIQRLMNNPQLRATLASNLKQKIERDFSLSKMLEKTIKLYLS